VETSEKVNSTSEELEVRFEKLFEHSLVNRKFEEQQFEKFNSFFRLSEGELNVSIVTANRVELPFESELVSALWLVTVSGSAKVTLGISHCVKQISMSRLTMVTTTQFQKPLRLLYNEDASFSFSNQYGTTKLPVIPKETTYLVGIVIHPDPEPQPGGILDYFQLNTLTCQYQYHVMYELRQQSKSFSYNHWRLHILSFKNICGIAVSPEYQ
jgi:hypothetical protein